jgi:transcriptional regulator with XRE-family HTH domain
MINFLCHFALMKSDNLDIDLLKLAERLKELRKSKGFTNYEQFAYTHGIGRAQYGRYENGYNINYKTLLKLIKIHDMTVSEFFSKGFD